MAPFEPGRARLDGIFVPAARSAAHTESALRLGAALGAPVVVMCSGKARTGEVAALADDVPGVTCWPVAVTRNAGSTFPDFETTGFPAAIVGARGNLSVKRNLGLLIGRLAGWRTVLFLDDDIVGLRPRSLTRAVSGLDFHMAVGMPPTDFPDNSVVCHGRRFIPSSRQGVFVGGNALAVRVDRCDSFFPEIYNEDWFFLAPLLARRQAAAHGHVGQMRFDPFEIADRATTEEFGDVLGEGLLGHLHHGSLNEPPTLGYWRAFLRRRARFIAEAIAACEAQATESSRARAALRALERAEHARAQILPSSLVDYVAAWLDDLRLWREHLTGIPHLGTLEAALNWLDLPVSPPATSPGKDAE